MENVISSHSFIYRDRNISLIFWHIDRKN